MVNERTVDSINTLARFCARRDVPALTREALGAPADVAMLFGGTILAGADVFADAMREHVASHYMIVGGQGHTTSALRCSLRERMGWDDIESSTEAALFDRYLKRATRADGPPPGTRLDQLRQQRQERRRAAARQAAPA